MFWLLLLFFFILNHSSSALLKTQPWHSTVKISFPRSPTSCHTPCFSLTVLACSSWNIPSLACGRMSWNTSGWILLDQSSLHTRFPLMVTPSRDFGTHSCSTSSRKHLQVRCLSRVLSSPAHPLPHYMGILPHMIPPPDHDLPETQDPLWLYKMTDTQKMQIEWISKWTRAQYIIDVRIHSASSSPSSWSEKVI